MFLVELFKDSKRVIPSRRVKRVSDQNVYTFSFDEGEYHVVFTKQDKNLWEIDFGYVSSEHQYSQDIIGTGGNAIVIFATVLDIIRTFVEDRNPAGLNFTAEEPSRQKLYRRLAKNFGKVTEKKMPHGIWFTVQLRKVKNDIK